MDSPSNATAAAARHTMCGSSAHRGQQQPQASSPAAAPTPEPEAISGGGKTRDPRSLRRRRRRPDTAALGSAPRPQGQQRGGQRPPGGQQPASGGGQPTAHPWISRRAARWRSLTNRPHRCWDSDFMRDSEGTLAERAAAGRLGSMRALPSFAPLSIGVKVAGPGARDKVARRWST
eukprot:4696351-Pleurochrysis_carterae.AAC.1